MKLIGIYLFLVLIVVSCGREIKIQNNLETIDLESNIGNMEVVKLSQFTDNIHYVPLQSEGSELFKYVYTAEITDNFILVHGSRTLTLYDTSGKYLRNIGSLGRGPGEYQLAFIIGITENKKIYLKQLGDLYEYSIEGAFMNKYKGLFNVDNQYYMDQVFIVDDSLFLGFVPNSTGQSNYKAFLINKFGEIKHRYENYIKFNIKGESVKITNFDVCFHIFNHVQYYKDIFNDTLFCLNDENEFTPRYVLNLGRYKLPDSERSKGEIDRMDYSFIKAVYQTDEYLFLDCSLGYRFPAKRLTPFSLIEGGSDIWYSTTSVLGVFNKISRDIVFSEPTSTDNFMFTTGLYNDIDAGPRFMPNKMVNDSTMVMWVPAKELKAHIASDDFKNGAAKYPEKKRKLEELAENLSEYDNPVLMFVTFR
jgi:hypothetical protein